MTTSPQQIAEQLARKCAKSQCSLLMLERVKYRHEVKCKELQDVVLQSIPLYELLEFVEAHKVPNGEYGFTKYQADTRNNLTTKLIQLGIEL